ncbi:MAG: hypothetical protein AAF170_12255, partial [Bacteroidota bacterium]
AWVQQSLDTHVAFTSPGPQGESYEYGYLWWLKSLDVEGELTKVAYMGGAGGNLVVISPDHNAVVVVTSENFNRRDAHALSYRVLSDFALAAASI